MKKLLVILSSLFLFGFSTSYDMAAKKVESPSCVGLVSNMEIASNILAADLKKQREEITRAFATVKLEECKAENAGIVTVILAIEYKKDVDGKEVKWCMEASSSADVILVNDDVEIITVIEDGKVIKNEECKK